MLSSLAWLKSNPNEKAWRLWVYSWWLHNLLGYGGVFSHWDKKKKAAFVAALSEQLCRCPSGAWAVAGLVFQWEILTSSL